MVLEEGMNVRIVLFPEGDDPDSFVRRHRSIEVEEYIAKNSKDFISFKTNLLLEETANDPIKKAGLAKEIVQTIALIPDSIYRSVYVKECSRLLELPEQTLLNELNKILRNRFRKQVSPDFPEQAIESVPQQEFPKPEGPESSPTYYQERELVKILLHFGRNEVARKVPDEFGNEVNYSENVAQFIIEDLSHDQIVFENETHKKIFDLFSNAINEGVVPGEHQFISNPEPDVALLSADLLTSPYELDDWARKKIYVKTELETLMSSITSTLYKYKERIIDMRREALLLQLKETPGFDDQMILLNQINHLNDIRFKINEILGIVISK